MRYKVSNVCQLLDKSVIPATQTINGVTFTNNGDGSITVTGTSTDSYSYCNIILRGSVSLKVGHVYVNNTVRSTTYVESIFEDSSGDHYEYIKKITEDTDLAMSVIRLGNAKADAVTLYPQLFDLTEMYGAGNEPTTVDQFRADFPDEYYEYSPECWKRIRELRYVAETKNLFDISQADITQYDGYWRSNKLYDNHFYTLNVEGGKTYTVTLEAYAPLDRNDGLFLSAQTGSYYTDGTSLFTELIGDYSPLYWYKHTRTFTIPAGVTQITFSTLVSVRIRNFQLEEGSTATAYQPYGYLGMRQGKYVADKRPVQLVKNGDFSDGLNNWSKQVSLTTLTLHDDFVNISCTNTTSSRIYPGILSTNTKTIIKNHIYATYIKYRMNNFNTKKWYRNIYGYGFVTVWATVDIDKMGQIVEETRFFTYTGVSVKRAYQQIYFMIEANDYVDFDIFNVEVFDLTEMYGAGNEPTTVDQFRADFPDEYYEYNPYNYISFN